MPAYFQGNRNLPDTVFVVIVQIIAFLPIGKISDNGQPFDFQLPRSVVEKKCMINFRQ